VTRILLAQPLVPIAGQERLVAALQRHGRAVVGEPLEAHGVPIYTDARHYAAAGVPAVLYGAGPRTLVEATATRRRETEARRPAQGDRGRRPGAGGPAGAGRVTGARRIRSGRTRRW